MLVWEQFWEVFLDYLGVGGTRNKSLCQVSCVSTILMISAPRTEPTPTREVPFPDLLLSPAGQIPGNVPPSIPRPTAPADRPRGGGPGRARGCGVDFFHHTYGYQHDPDALQPPIMTLVQIRPEMVPKIFTLTLRLLLEV